MGPIISLKNVPASGLTQGQKMGNKLEVSFQVINIEKRTHFIFIKGTIYAGLAILRYVYGTLN